jgi:DnaJ-class molecular chaperone
MGVAYPGWAMDSDKEYVINNERHNTMGEGYSVRYSINDPKIFKTFESKINKLRKSDSLEELKKNYRELAKVYHPDKPNGSHTDFIDIKKEYDNLITSF